MRRSLLACLVLLAGFALATAGFAQGVQSATLNGSVTSADGEPLPGVTVTVTSPNLIGERTAVSGVNGDYIFKNLPPGAYTVRFTLEGMKSVERTASLQLGANARSDAAMEVAAAEETIVVTGEAPSALETTMVGANFESKQINQLPIGRAPITVAELAPGLTDNTPVAGQVTINGALAYDNLFLINGVNVQDPIFGQQNGLFIEDAIEETQVMTSGISAEYGGFTGGVVNAITKSGGNQFAGSLRVDLDKPEWRDETPFEKGRGTEREGDMNKAYSATLGGPILRDRLWFFLAGRERKLETARTLAVSGIGFTTTTDSPRYEIKLTGAITSNHTLQVSYLNNDLELNNSTQLTPVDPNSIYGVSSQPNDGTSVSYSGVFTNNLFGELRWSEKAFQFSGLGGTAQELVNSPFYSYGITTGQGGLYNQPYFDATDPEDRDNEQTSAALSYFLSTESIGSHDLKFGAERFLVTRTGGNSQSSTDFVFNSDFKVDANGDPVLDANGRFIPLFIPYVSSYANYIATRGAQLDITTDSFFVNDRWALNANWSFNLGFRYEKTTSEATGGINTLDTDSVTPRLGASWDIKGDGKYKVDVTYAQYAGRYNPSILGRNTPVGNPTGIYAYYVGPAGEGRGFAPGIDPNNYVIYAAASPTQNIFFEDGLSSPTSTEYTASFGFQLPKGGYGKVTYVNRDTKDFIDDFIDADSLALGCVNVVVQGLDVGCFDRQIYRNSDGPKRKYEGLQFQAQYSLTDAWQLGGNLTWQMKNEGTYEGEGGQSIGATPYANRPEVYPADRVNPYGNFDDYQEFKVRAWTNYTLDFGRAGALDIGAIFRYDSPLTFSYSVANQNPTTAMRANNPGYSQLPRYTVFFGDRGAGEFNSVFLTDLALTYSVPVWKSFEPYLKFTITNLLNEDKLVNYNTGIRVRPGSTLDANGVPNQYDQLSTFGTGTSNLHYAIPREYVISAGFRF